MKREPVLTVASITALVSAIVALLVAFGLDLTGDQEKAILGVAAIVAPILVGLFSRPKVTPVEPAIPGQVGQTNLLYVLLVIAAALVVILLLFAVIPGR